MSVTIYLATPMSGRTGNDLWREAITLKQIYEKHGVDVITPVDKEGIPMSDDPIPDRTDEEGTLIWTNKDKNQIRKADVFVYIWKPRSSQGVTKEYCLARGVLWKPCVGVYRRNVTPGFITRKEDDYVASTHEEAALVIKARWGTWWKRFVWRIKMLNRALPKWILNQLQEFF